MSAVALVGNMVTAGALPASGCKLRSVLQNTQTPTPLYSDVGLTTPTTNPYIGDSDGRLAFYFDSAINYDWTVTTSDGATILWQASVVGGVVTVTNTLGIFIHQTWSVPLSTALGSGWPALFAQDAEAAIGSNNVRAFPTYAAMTAATGLVAGMVCKTISYDNILDLNDGSSGDWLVVSGSTRTPNGGTILAHTTDSDITFHRLLGGNTPNVKMWGARWNGITNDATAVNTAINTMLGWDVATATTQTTGFTAAPGFVYPCNTSGGAFTANMPADPAHCDRVGFYDANNTFDTNNLTINGNGATVPITTVVREGQWVVFEYDASVDKWFYAKVGGKLKLPAGRSLWTSAVSIDESIRRAIEETRTLTLEGEGVGSTHIFTTHAGRALEYQGNAGGWGAYVNLLDFTLNGPGSSTVGSVGLWMDNAPWFTENLHIWNYERGRDWTDCLSATARQPLTRFCKWGFRARFSDASRPNSIVLDNPNFGNNSHYAGRVEGGAGFEIRTGQNEGNGQVGGTSTSGGGAWFFIDCGVEGKTGVTVHSAYTEGTGGDQAFYFEQTTGSSVHTLIGCSFANISSAYYVTSQIRTSQSGGAYLRVNAFSCSFGALSDYVESVSRKYVNAQAGTFRAFGCRFESAVATSITNWDEAGAYSRKRGLVLSNNASDATNDIDISAGGWLDSTFQDVMVLGTGITKRLDAAWAVGTGNGGLDTGSIADTTYHVWLIKRFDTGVVDALFSTSATSPTMPSGYDYKVRIGSVIRVSGALLLFDQMENVFLLKAPGLAFTADNGDLTTARVTKTLAGIPTGIVVEPIITTKLTDLTPASDKFMRVSALVETDATAGSTNSQHQIVATDGTADEICYAEPRLRTNTSAQIGFRTSLSDTDTYASCISRGWRELWQDAA